MTDPAEHIEARLADFTRDKRIRLLSLMAAVVGVLSASPGALGGLRSQSHLIPLLLNLHCWVAPTTFALGRAASAFDEEGHLVDASSKQRAQAARIVRRKLEDGKLSGPGGAPPFRPIQGFVDLDAACAAASAKRAVA